jgi:hypothetical protein
MAGGRGCRRNRTNFRRRVPPGEQQGRWPGKKGSMRKGKTGMAALLLVGAAALGMLVATAQVAEAQIVTNVALVATPPLVPGTEPVLVRLHKVGASQEFAAPGGAFQVQSITVVNAIVDNGTIIVNRRNGNVTNALATVTASSGAGTATIVDAYGMPNAHLIYSRRSGASYSNDEADTIVITGTATNAIVELKGIRWY